MIEVTARGVFFVGLNETPFPGGVVEVLIFDAVTKLLVDAEFDIVIMNALAGGF